MYVDLRVNYTQYDFDRTGAATVGLWEDQTLKNPVFVVNPAKPKVPRISEFRIYPGSLSVPPVGSGRCPSISGSTYDPACGAEMAPGVSFRFWVLPGFTKKTRKKRGFLSV